MTPSDQVTQNIEFFANAARILTPKAHDYAPEGVVGMDIFEQAMNLGSTPERVLFEVFLGKHLTAIRRYIQGFDLTSEPIEMRLIDAANFIAILHLVIHHGPRIAADILHYWERQPCTYGSADKAVHDQLCRRCRMLRYTTKYIGSWQSPT